MPPADGGADAGAREDAVVLAPLGEGVLAPMESLSMQPMGSPAPGQTLKQMVDAAASGDTVTIAQDMAIDETIVIPAGKEITLKDDGSAHNITSTVDPMFQVEGTLTIDATANENLTFHGITQGKADAGYIASIIGGTLNLKHGTLVGTAGTNSAEGLIYGTAATFELPLISWTREMGGSSNR